MICTGKMSQGKQVRKLHFGMYNYGRLKRVSENSKFMELHQTRIYNSYDLFPLKKGIL